VWADRRLRQEASRFVGQWSDPIDDRVRQLPAPTLSCEVDRDPDELDLLRSMAEERADVADYAAALSSAATSERNQRVLLAYRLQSSLGDRSPAVTVGRRFGMTPAAVRQVVKRTSDRLAEHWRPADDHVALPLARATVAA
jgi:hypothetical protein